MRLFVVVFLIVTVSAGAKRRQTDKPKPKATTDIDQRQAQIRVDYKNFVPFGHIFREGAEDPKNNNKPPIDLLELDTIYLKDGPYARELISKHPANYQEVIKDESKTNRPRGRPRDSPQDIPHEISDDSKEINGHTGFRGDQGLPSNNNSNVNEIQAFWNLEGIFERNLAEPPRNRLRGGQPKGNVPELEPSPRDKSAFFANNSYGLLRDMNGQAKTYNFTTCDEFGKRAKFHPKDIVKLDWVPFYIWTYKSDGVVTVSRIHRFSFPTKKYVQNFKDEFGASLSKDIDWEQPKLIMNGSAEMLLVAVDRTGLFDAIPHMSFQSDMLNNPAFKKNLQIPISTIRIKLVGSYLAMMYCDGLYAVVMAISGSEPNSPKKCTSEAAKLKLKGEGFPVQRDMDMEAREIRTRWSSNLRREQDKFITLEDQMEAARARFTR